MGNKIDADLAAADVVIDLIDRQADTIDCDRPLVSQKTRQASRNFDAQFPRLANRLETADLAQSIDMARDQMAVQRIAHAQGMRSEEHTSELQSLMPISYAGLRLKTKNRPNYSHHCAH